MKKFVLIMLIAAILFSGCNSADSSEEIFEQANITFLYGPIMENENGYYYIRTDDDSIGGKMRFADKKTGKDIILCNKPECLHDSEKSPFCAAVCANDTLYAAYYDGYIYTEEHFWDGNKSGCKLFRASTDGTERTEVATIYEGKNDGFFFKYIDNRYIAIYKGKAFVPYSDDNSMAHGLAEIDLKTGRVKYFDELSGKETNGYQKLIPYGNYLYYYISEKYYQNPQLFRYNMKNGETEKIEINGRWRDYCVIDGKIIFLRYDDDRAEKLYSFNIETGEETELTDDIKNSAGEKIFDGYNRNYNHNDDIDTCGFVLTDDEHIFVFSSSQNNSENDICVYSKTGEFLCSFTGPRYENNASFSGDIHIKNGNVYFINYYEAVCCPLENILSGNIKWETVYTIRDREKEGQ